MSADACPPAPPPHPWRIALVSATVLTLELAFIRQVPAEVRAISYFTNLLLMAAFFGFGTGCILEKSRRSFALLFPCGLALTWGFVAFARGLMIFEQASSVHYWLQYENVAGQARHLPLLPAAVVAFLVTAAPFVALGQELARRMAAHPRLVAYSWDIVGSLAGVLAFTAASQLGLPPWVWPPVLAVVWAVGLSRGPAARVSSVAAGLLFVTFSHTPHAGSWSPYYFVQYEEEPVGLRVWVNSSFHQLGVDFAAGDALAGPVRRIADKFSMPFHAFRRLHGRSPRRVLVLGAGTGNDVAVALRNGVERVDAVEIDARILELGQERNRARPYQDPRVRTRVDDARHFVRSTPERYDLVVLGTLDSQTLLSGNANIRLENYVYTVEAFRDARRLLAPGGLLAAYYSVAKPWLYGRIGATVRGAFGEQWRMIHLEDPFLFNTIVLAGEQVDRLGIPQTSASVVAESPPATDDWPFMYVQKPGIPPLYLELGAVVLALVGGVSILARRLQPGGGSHSTFFLLGLGFTLVESAAVVRMALLFGSTWLTSAVVFSAVLGTVYLSNLAVLRGVAPSLRWSWAGIAAGLLANWLAPLGLLVGLTGSAQLASAVILIGLPVFCAAVAFSRLFAATPEVGGAFGANMVGAMAGGMVEYCSMWTGMRSVWLVALAVYLGALLASRPRGRSPVEPRRGAVGML